MLLPFIIISKGVKVWVLSFTLQVLLYNVVICVKCYMKLLIKTNNLDIKDLGLVLRTQLCPIFPDIGKLPTVVNLKSNRISTCIIQ
jgi:hypothetical protein